MRHGLLLVGADMSLADQVTLARAAEAAGLDSIFCVEGYRSGFVPMTALAAATAQIRIGSYILNAYGRSPFLTALSAIDLDELSGGRLVLGVGSGNRHINEDFQGLAHERPLAKLRDYVEILRKVFRAERGEVIEHDGRVHRMRWTRTVSGVRATIPVWLSAIFPRTIDVAASVADGVALGVLFSPEYLREVIRPRAFRAAEAAGRDPRELEFPMGALIAIDENRDRARNALRRAIAGFFHPLPHPYYEFLLREQGFGDVADLALREIPRGRFEPVMERMDDGLIDRLAFAGSAADCAQRLAEYEGLADEAIFLNVTPPVEGERGPVTQSFRALFSIR